MNKGKLIPQHLERYREINPTTFGTVSVNYYRTANVEVNIFKMPGQLVRVRMVAKKEKGFDFGAKIKEKFARVVRLYEISTNFKASNTDAKLIDYLFDLSDAKARDAYNQLVAPHDITEFDNKEEWEKLKTAVFGKSKSASTLMINEDVVLKEIEAGNKAITQLMTTQSDIASAASRFKINLLNIFRIDQSSIYSDIKMQRQNGKGEIVDSSFSRTIESINREKAISDKNKYQIGTILTDEMTGNPMGVVLTKTSNKQKLSDLSEAKWSAYLKNLPMTASSANEIDKKLADLKAGGRMTTRETLFVNAEEFLKNSANIQSSGTTKIIENIFMSAIKNNAMLTAVPANPDGHNLNGNAKAETHSRYLTYPKLWNDLNDNQKLAEYKSMYSFDYTTVIPGALEKIANKNLERSERLLAFNALMENPLFSEIGVNLLTQIIPAESLLKTVVYEVLLQSENSDIMPLKINYGDAKGSHYITSQNALLAKSFSLEPGAELRVYLRSNGTLKSVQEVIAETRLPSSK